MKYIIKYNNIYETLKLFIDSILNQPNKIPNQNWFIIFIMPHMFKKCVFSYLAFYFVLIMRFKSLLFFNLLVVL